MSNEICLFEHKKVFTNLIFIWTQFWLTLNGLNNNNNKTMLVQYNDEKVMEVIKSLN